jgi:hypothetical protein
MKTPGTVPSSYMAREDVGGARDRRILKALGHLENAKMLTWSPRGKKGTKVFASRGEMKQGHLLLELPLTMPTLRFRLQTNTILAPRGLQCLIARNA